MRGVAPPVRKDETVESIAVQAEKEKDQQEEQHVSEGEASMAANKPQHQTVEPSPPEAQYICSGSPLLQNIFHSFKLYHLLEFAQSCPLLMLKK